MATILLTGTLLTQYRRTLRFLRPHTRNFVFLFVLGLVSTVITLAQPYLTKLLIDNALLRRNMQGLWYLAGWMAICSALSFLLGLVTTRWYTKLSALVLFDMRLEVFQRLQLLSPRFYAKTKTGDIVSRLNGDISEFTTTQLRHSAFCSLEFALPYRKRWHDGISQLEAVPGRRVCNTFGFLDDETLSTPIARSGKNAA